VLVVSPGDETYRGYLLEQVAAAYDVVLLTGAEPSWEKPFIHRSGLLAPVNDAQPS
jgi:hypothetical protein